MKDYKSMYHYMCGRMESAAETVGFANEFLKVSHGIINEITDTNEKNVTRITDILSEVIDDTKSLKSTINDIVSNHSKSVRELNQLINMASLRFEIIKEHMEKSQEKIEAKMEKEYERYISENKSETNFENTEEEEN